MLNAVQFMNIPRVLSASRFTAPLMDTVRREVKLVRMAEN